MDGHDYASVIVGTVVAMETQPGILKASQNVLIEELRDKIENELSSYLAA